MPLKKGLLISVGTGVGGTPKSILHAITLAVSEKNPNFVAFVVSEQSSKNAQEVTQRLELNDEQYEVFQVEDPNDLDKCVAKTKEAYQWLLNKGLRKNEIVADFTSGTKPMSSAIVLVAFQEDIATLSYVQGMREQGLVKKGTERVISFTPLISKIYSREKDIYKSLLRYQFDIAKSNIREIQDYKDLVANLGFEIDFLQYIVEGYHCWDLFKHHEAKKSFEKAYSLLEKIEREEFKKIFPGKEVVKQLGYLGNLINQNKKKPDIIADLLANANRRIQEGKYDDATARLYRIFELIGQTVLELEYGLDSSDLNIKKIEEQLKDKFINWKDILRRDNDGKIKIGARKVYELLKDLGHLLGNRVEEFKTLLAQRNYSILAHGLRPINKEKTEEFFEKIFKLSKETFEGFELLYQKSQFPWNNEKKMASLENTSS